MITNPSQLAPPTDDEKERALRMTADMRYWQKRFFSSPQGSDHRNEAKRRARTLEQQLDRLMQGWTFE